MFDNLCQGISTVMGRSAAGLAIAGALGLVSVTWPFAAQARTEGPDAGGYYFVDNLTDGGPVFAYEDLSTSDSADSLFTTTSTNDESHTTVSLPFLFPLYSEMVSELTVTTNGVIYFEDDRYLGYSTSECIPGESQYDPENYILAPFWDDLQVAPLDSAAVLFEVRGQAPQRRAIIQYHGVKRFNTTGALEFQVILFEATGEILFQYAATSTGSAASSLGGRALVGVQRDIDVGLSYGCKQKVLADGLAILFTDRWDVDGDGVDRLTDCDDEDASVYPGEGDAAAPEICDDKDNDCDGQIDEDEFTLGESWYPDGDGDGYGVPGIAIVACDQPEGYGLTPDDCNDEDAAISPGASELCNGYDDNCDGVIDSDASDLILYYRDYDRDGFGTDELTTLACEPPTSRDVEVGGDCDDRDPDAFPGGFEVCDSDDNDCDGTIDEDATNTLTIYLDQDGDGFGGNADTFEACVAPDDNYVYEGGDCEDGNADIFPGQEEVCNGLDDDCSGEVDDNPTDGSTFYADKDNDLYPAEGSVDACEAPGGYITVDSTPSVWDCNDNDPDVNPGAIEVCNNVDDDCDTLRDEGYDLDEDGLADCVDSCPNDPNNDSDEDGVCGDVDNCPTIANPGQEDVNGNEIGDACEQERCDGLDNDGDGAIDEDFADSDGDGLADCVDSCPDDSSPDTDGDGHCSTDNCPDVSNAGQEDGDGDGLGDVCDLCPDDADDGIDSDGDGVPDACDNCPSVGNADQADGDQDGVGDACQAFATPTVEPTPALTPTEPPQTPASSPTPTPGVTETPTVEPEPPTETPYEEQTPTPGAKEGCGCAPVQGGPTGAAWQWLMVVAGLCWRRRR